MKPWYMYGLISISALGWVAGTFFGAAMGQILPAALSDAMGIMLYGMFIAIIVPPAKKEHSIILAIGLAVATNVLCAIAGTPMLLDSATGASPSPEDAPAESSEVETSK